MDQIIVYGSHYGTTRRYAQQLSERTGIPAVRFREAPGLAGMRTIVYLGGLYAGGVVGLAGTLRGLTLRSGQRLILVTVGLADPGDAANRARICASLQNQLPPELVDRAEIFHLRGGIDYSRLSLRHRVMMAVLYRSLRRLPPDRQTAEDRALLASYGTRLDFTDPAALDPIVESIRRGEG